MNKKLQGFLSWVGVWVTSLYLAEYVFGISNPLSAMMLGALAFVIAEATERWLVKPTPRDVMSAPKAGLTPRGKPMPQTMAEWKHMAHLYADKIMEDKETISKLKKKNNVLQQRLDQLQE